MRNSNSNIEIRDKIYMTGSSPANHENLSHYPPSSPPRSINRAGPGDGGGPLTPTLSPAFAEAASRRQAQGERGMKEQNLLIFFQNGFNLIHIDFSVIFLINHHHGA
jgi:hypothetical protein